MDLADRMYPDDYKNGWKDGRRIGHNGMAKGARMAKNLCY